MTSSNGIFSAWLALCAGNPPVAGEFPLQRQVTRSFFLFSLICVWINDWLIEAEWRIYASLNWVIIGSDNGLSPVRHQAIIWTNAGILLIGPLGTNFGEILIRIQTFSFKKLHLKRRLQNDVYFVSASMSWVNNRELVIWDAIALIMTSLWW